MTIAVAPKKITVVYDNFLDDCLALTTSTEVPTLPATMLRNQARDIVWRTQGCAAPVLLDFGFGRPVLPSYYGMVNHNLSSAATIRLQLQNSNDFSVATMIDEAISFSEGVTGFGEGGFGEGGFGGTLAGYSWSAFKNRAMAPPYSYFFVPPAEAPLYGRITITDLYNPDGYLQIGRLYCAEQLTFERNYDYGCTVECIDTSSLLLDGYRVLGIDKKETIFQLSLKIGRLTSVERYYQLLNFWLTVGMTGYFIVILDPSTAETRELTSYYCRFAEHPMLEHAFYNQHAVTLKFVEAL